MQIHEIIIAQKSYERYLQKYERPLISHYGKLIPNNIEAKFIQQATVEEIALYYMGYHGSTPISFVGVLASLEKHRGLDLPVIEGILTEEYWQRWSMNNLIAIMDQGKVFGR